MFIETQTEDPPRVQLEKLLADLVMVPGETNYAQRSIFIHAKISRLMSMVDVVWRDGD